MADRKLKLLRHVGRLSNAREDWMTRGAKNCRKYRVLGLCSQFPAGVWPSNKARPTGSYQSYGNAK